MSALTETNLGYRPGEHPVHGTWLSVDVLAFTEDLPEARIVLITRAQPPHAGARTLPGGLLAAWNAETVEGAARRIVAEKAGVQVTGGVVPVSVVSDPHRDERGHTVSIVVATRVPAGTAGAVAGADLPEAMPFAHTAMARAALAALGSRILTDPQTTYALLGEQTTFTDTYALLRACGDCAENTVRARLERCPLYTATAEIRRGGGRGRPSRVYRAAGAA